MLIPFSKASRTSVTPKIIEMMPNGYVLMIADTEDRYDYLFIIKGFVRNDKPAAKPTKEEIELYKKGLLTKNLINLIY